MAYVPVPKDLEKIKTKVMLGLTKRQLICFSIAAAIGLPLFFLAKAHMSINAAVLIMLIAMLPMFLFAMYEKNGLPLEVRLKHIYELRIKNPRKRPYETNNFYELLMRQDKLDKEVQAIVSKAKGTTQSGLCSHQRG